MDEQFEKRLSDLESKLQTILDSVAASEDTFNRSEFKKRNAEKLGKYEEQLKKLNGDDFDIYNAAYDEYNADFKDVEEDAYVTQLISEIDSKIAKLKEALGDDHVMVESDGDTTTVETHDEVVEAEKGEESKDEAEKDESEEKEESDEDELAKFEAELAEDYDKYMKK